VATAQERLDALRLNIDELMASLIQAHGTPEYTVTKISLDALMRYEKKLEADVSSESPLSPINYAQFVRGDEGSNFDLA